MILGVAISDMAIRTARSAEWMNYIIGFLWPGMEDRDRMNKLKFNGSEQLYEGTLVPIGKNKVSIEFVGGIPKGLDTSVIEAFTASGVKYLELAGFTTEYRRVDASLILSNDGSVYVGEIEQEIDQVKALEESKVQKKNEVGDQCKNIITAGFDMEVGGEQHHFRLTTDDQLNLFGKQMQILAGEEKFEYHEDGNPCRYFSKEEMQAVITKAMAYKTYHTTYCNALNMWIASAESLEEVKGISYGVAIPEAYQNEVLKDYMALIAGEGASETTN